MSPRIALALTFGLFLGAGASAQEPAPAPVAPPAPAGETPQSDRAAVRQHWKEMSPEERRRVQESYEHWKTLTREKQELLRKRHERLEEERRATDRLAHEDDSKPAEKQPAERHRKELTERALKLLKERFDRLPPEVKKRIEQELRDAPPGERPEIMRRNIEREIKVQIRRALLRRVERGELSREDVETLARRSNEAPTKGERARLLRDFVLAHPQAFHLTPEQRERVQKISDPLEFLRFIDHLRRGRNKAPAPPRPAKTPKDRDEPAAPAEGHRPH